VVAIGVLTSRVVDPTMPYASTSVNVVPGWQVFLPCRRLWINLC
jgi:hypothetical protein